MKKRGPPSKKSAVRAARQKQSSPASSSHSDAVTLSHLSLYPSKTASTPKEQSYFRLDNDDSRLLPSLSDWSFDLDSLDWQLLDRYTRFFSTTYPTCKDASSPFLKVLIPLAMQSRPVLDAMLALSCVQSWEDGKFTMDVAMLRYRSKAIRGCSDLVKEIMENPQARQEALNQDGNSFIPTITSRTMEITGDDAIIPLLATSVLLMLYEKLHGEGRENGTIHLQLFAQLFPSQLFVEILDKVAQNSQASYPDDAMVFLSNSFLYNDLVRSTSLRTSTLSSFYLDRTRCSPLDQPKEDLRNRFYFPTIIARISANDMSVTDCDINAWDGTLSWLPSLALQVPDKNKQTELLPLSDPMFLYDPFFQSLESFSSPSGWSQERLVSELYRVAAISYRRQRQLENSQLGLGNLSAWAIELLRLMPSGSQYETALLWPIALIGPEFTEETHREYIFSRLQELERHCMGVL
ncbi:hypothetical protein FSARC_13858 [Fusarium sarcochroum]|uniref:Uncharacterized protein n=1 Tax=Fusarium sarcochroum TaxID=1208366 RepID=A0A8H4SYM5_9HYPO|nr:hypothetical protein FSARC_13858 [Fusarium sarcochroum]